MYISKVSTVGECEVGCLAVLAQPCVLEEGVARGLATFDIRDAVVVGNVPFPVFDLHGRSDSAFSGDGYRLSFRVQQPLSVYCPVPFSVRSLLHRDVWGLTIASVCSFGPVFQGHGGHFAIGIDKGDDVRAVLFVLNVADELFPCDQFLQFCELGVEGRDQCFHFCKSLIHIVQARFKLVIVVARCRQQYNQDISQESFHKYIFGFLRPEIYKKIKYVIICKRNFNLNNMPGTHL